MPHTWSGLDLAAVQRWACGLVLSLGELLLGQAGPRIYRQHLESRPGNWEPGQEEDSERPREGRDWNKAGGCPESLGQRSGLRPAVEGGSRGDSKGASPGPELSGHGVSM